MDGENLKKLRIFAASPSDVVAERTKLETVVATLKPIADHLKLTLEVVDWRTVVPDGGRAQQIIFDQLNPTSWDIFVGILWHRFGTPPGAKDKSGKEYLSGTEEEFKTAYELWKKHTRPRLMIYRCTRSLPYDIDPDQFKFVKEFFKLIEDIKGDYHLLYQVFDTTEIFEKLLLDHLQKLLIEYSEQETEQALTPQTLAAIAPTLIPDTLPRRTPFFGRKKEITEALRALSPDDRGWGLVIDGIGGIGKTALALEVAYLCKEKKKFNSYIFVSAKHDRLEPLGIQEMTLAATTLNAFVDEIARAIGHPRIGQLARNQKSRALINALHETKALLILDNLETLTSSEQSTIGEFLRNLPTDCKAIVTSRRRASEAAITIRLEKLDWDSARELIESEIERHSDVRRALKHVGETGWKKLYDETGGSPLAITWAIGMMRARGFSFEHALTLLRDGSSESDLNAFIFSQAQEKMDANEKAVLSALSLFDGPATFEALSVTANLDRRALDIVLERLRALSLVDITESESESGIEQYSLHPLIRRFAHADLLKDGETERAMRKRFSQYTLDREQALSSRMHGLIAKQNKEYLEAEQYLKEALIHWRNMGNDEWVGTVLNDLGELAHERTDYESAEDYYHEALKLTEKISHKDGQVNCLGNLGEFALDRAQWVDAVKWFELEFMLAKEIGRFSSVAQAQFGLARAWKAQGRSDFAFPLAQDALNTFEKLQRKDLANVRVLVEKLTKEQKEDGN